MSVLRSRQRLGATLTPSWAPRCMMTFTRTTWREPGRHRLNSLRTASPVKLEVRGRHADGHYVWLEINGNPLIDDEGQVMGAIVGIRDITQRKQTEEALTRSEQYAQRLVDHSRDLIMIIEADSTIRYASPADRADPRLYATGADRAQHLRVGFPRRSAENSLHFSGIACPGPLRSHHGSSHTAPRRLVARSGDQCLESAP